LRRLPEAQAVDPVARATMGVEHGHDHRDAKRRAPLAESASRDGCSRRPITPAIPVARGPGPAFVRTHCDAVADSPEELWR
jgi:hypothetical protein